MRDGAKWILALVAGAALAAAAQSPQPAAQSPSNPFPENSAKIPVVPTDPTAETPAMPNDETAEATALMLPSEDRDPARSPDDVEDNTAPGELSSSSLKGNDKVLPWNGNDEEKKGRHRKLEVPAESKPKTKKDVATDNIQVASYYLERKNWQAALSRFESAMVMDPENPDIYFGLAVTEQHLGRLASARTHYQMVAEFDPDSKQGKEARRALKDPAIVNGVDPKPKEEPTGSLQ
jgi:tetratricopeptide (TPR) repeat protein